MRLKVAPREAEEAPQWEAFWKEHARSASLKTQLECKHGTGMAGNQVAGKVSEGQVEECDRFLPWEARRSGDAAARPLWEQDIWSTYPFCAMVTTIEPILCLISGRNTLNVVARMVSCVGNREAKSAAGQRNGFRVCWKAQEVRWAVGGGGIWLMQQMIGESFCARSRIVFFVSPAIHGTFS